MAIIAADVVGLTTPMADRIRARVAEVVGCDPAAVLLNSSHTHAAPWPGATIKLGGEFDDWTETELRYWDSVPDRYASVALEAVGRLAPARVSGGVGRAAGLAVNRRERTADGRTILGWNPDGRPRRFGRRDPRRRARRAATPRGRDRDPRVVRLPSGGHRPGLPGRRARTSWGRSGRPSRACSGPAP